ncbi:MAG: hypothetical protein IPJ69_10145 [Deltaproteobacteria bacterium]|nr:MAG: hypothetical protein IPJ69_10145 [Deltaproteobacteria bacterium]
MVEKTENKPSRVGIKPVQADPAAEKDQIMELVSKQLEEALKGVPKEKLDAAKKEAEKILEGDLSWADMSQYTPEKLYEIAETGYERFKIGQYDSAEKIFRGLTVLDVNNYYYHQMLGAVFQRKEKWPEALVEYSIAIDINPKDLVSLTNRGEVYLKIGVLDLANQDLEKAIALDTKNEDRWANRARMLKEQIKIARERHVKNPGVKK